MDNIKEMIQRLFEPTLKIIDEQTNCEHNWKDKDGSAYYRCNKCGYLADNQELDKLITIEKLKQKGATAEMIKKFKDYI